MPFMKTTHYQRLQKLYIVTTHQCFAFLVVDLPAIMRSPLLKCWPTPRLLNYVGRMAHNIAHGEQTTIFKMFGQGCVNYLEPKTMYMYLNHTHPFDVQH